MFKTINRSRCNFNLTLNVKWCSEPQIFLGSCSYLWNEYHSLLHKPFVKRSFSSQRQELNNLKPKLFMITLSIILVTMFLKEMQLKAVVRNNPEQILSSEKDNLKILMKSKSIFIVYELFFIFNREFSLKPIANKVWHESHISLFSDKLK